MKRRLLLPEDNNVIYNQSYGLYHTCLYEKSPVDEFYVEVIKTKDNNRTTFHVDPLIMLFNQERLDNLGSMGSKQFLDSLQQKDDALKELRSKCTDDQLMDMLKSRYLQTPSEIMAYCRYIEGNIEQFNNDLKTIIEQRKEEISSSSSSNIDVTTKNIE